MHTFLDRQLLVDDHRIACYADGVRATGTVVFLHGTPSHSVIWREVLPRVRAAGYGVLAYDQLGYGYSERPAAADTSTAAQTELLAGLLDRLGIDSCVLIGHDLGGAITQRFAVQHRDRLSRAMLLNTVSYDSWPSETWRAIIRSSLDDYTAMSRHDFEDMMTRQLRMTVYEPGTMSGEVLESYLAVHRGPLGIRSFFEHQVRHYDSRYTAEIVPHLGEIDVPVRLLWGTEDRWQPIGYGHRLAGDIPGARLIGIPRAGHFVTEDAPHRVGEEILRFLAG